MRFAIISMSFYLLIHLAGNAMAEMMEFEIPNIEKEFQDKRFLELLPPKNEHQSQIEQFHCDGYLTNNPAEDFCSDEVPSDWRRLEFNGEVFYLVPLGFSQSNQK